MTDGTPKPERPTVAASARQVLIGLATLAALVLVVLALATVVIWWWRAVVAT